MRATWLAIALIGWVGTARADTPAARPEAPANRAEAPQALPDKTERVIALGRAWSHAKFFHPTLATKDIDWDRALVTAIPKVEAATTLAQYKAAVQGMLAVIGDPVTRVLDAPASTTAPAPSNWLTAPAPDLLEVKLAALATSVFDYFGTMQKGKQVVADAMKAKALIVDLRGASNDSAEFATEQLSAAFPAFDEWPTSRVIEHRGFRTQEGMTSGDYFSTFVTVGARPPHAGPKAGPAHVVFVADSDAPVPIHALALQTAGKATIVARGALRSDSGVLTAEISLGGGLRAQIRLSDSTWAAPVADVTIAADKDPLMRARELAKRPPKLRRRVRKAAVLAPLRIRDDADYAETPYPSREHRLLAGIRLWAVLDQFFPYRYLIADWDSVLREMLPRLDQAADRDAYLGVLREMGVRAGDGHINVFAIPRSPSIKGLPPFETRFVEGKLAVVRVIDAEETKRLGIAIGDVIETSDGKPVSQLLAEQRLVTSGSTDEARDQRIAQRMLGGDDGSTVKLRVRDARGATRELAATRKQQFAAALWAPRTSAHWKKLPGNIGYVDLTELTVPEVEVMFKELAATKALVLDMRGYPNGTARSIAPRINVKRAKYGAQFLQPLVDGARGDETVDSRSRFLQPLRPLPEGASLYTGKIAVLIDDRAISQSEHSCLFFQEAAGATFIGSPTHGANGDVTVMRLPGGLRMSFTGQEVRHVDGKQLQKVGIHPHVTVRPTLAGLRAGKDEVLERALVFLANGK